MRAKQTAILLAVVFVAYAVLIGWRGVLLIKVGTPSRSCSGSRSW